MQSKKGKDENAKMLGSFGLAVRLGNTRFWLCRFRWAQELVPLPAEQISASPTP